MTREEWLEQRKQFITASDVAAVMGLDPNKSRAKVLRLKTGQEEAKNIDRIPAVAAGRHLEAGILAWFAEDHADQYTSVSQNGQSLVVSPVLPCLAATPDGFAGDDPQHLVEVKCVDKSWPEAPARPFPNPEAVKNVGRAADGSGYPGHYWVQLQVQLHCTGLEWGWLTGLQGAHARADRFFRIDRAFESRMLTEVEKFWREVTSLRAFGE